MAPGGTDQVPDAVNFAWVQPVCAPENVYQNTLPSAVSSPTDDPAGFPETICS
ncbi:MAG: hypothetical protein JRN25_04325 [Nitrososphaerota archaeon]|nr:hypothetical protein [Nitrososphaerota archaeon]